jgi:hypothetical protein
MNLGWKIRLRFRSRITRRVTAEERGAEIVEFAVVLLGLLMLLIGMIWMGRAYNIYETMTRAAREGARYALAPTCAQCGNQFPSAAQVQAVVDGSLSASSLDPTKKTSYNFQTLVLTPTSDPPLTGVVVSFSYPVQLVIPFTTLNASTITISTRVQMRKEN